MSTDRPGMNLLAVDLPPPPQNPAGPSPLRRAGSVRRTSSIDMTWPDGRGRPAHFAARARDIVTREEGDDPRVIAEDCVEAMVAPDRTILSIASTPARPGIDGLVGVKGGEYLRSALNRTLPAEREAGSPLYLLIDDLAGASLISGWAWSRWTRDWMQRAHPEQSDAERLAARVKRMEGVCTGFRTGSSALTLAGDEQNCTAVGPLPHPRDPAGWHRLPEPVGVSMRRARRIDVWRDDAIRINATFQDSATTPEGGRVAIHEYLLGVVADPETMKLVSVEADARTVPYAECPSAVANVQRLLGTPLGWLRNFVLVELRRTAGCTHLNDALRALAEVPMLVAALEPRGEPL